MRKIIKFNAIDSTNDTLMSLADLMSLPSGSVVVSDFQNKGKGQQGKIWYSSAGKNLTFSILLRFDALAINKQFILNKAVSVAIARALDNYIDKTQLKWPNDIYVNSKKIAGILIENSISGNRISHSVIGIGVNVNETDFPFWVPNPTSLKLETNEEIHLNDLMYSICSNIESEVELINIKEKEIFDEYTGKLYKKDKIGVYKSKDSIFNAFIRGVDKVGRLKLELEEGEIKYFQNGEIVFLN